VRSKSSSGNATWDMSPSLQTLQGTKAPRVRSA
jgi:hypothetical protein